MYILSLFLKPYLETLPFNKKSWLYENFYNSLLKHQNYYNLFVFNFKSNHSQIFYFSRSVAKTNFWTESNKFDAWTNGQYLISLFSHIDQKILHKVNIKYLTTIFLIGAVLTIRISVTPPTSTDAKLIFTLKLTI